MSPMQVRKMVEDAMVKHGLKSAAQRAKLKARLYDEMEETLEGQVRAPANALLITGAPTALPQTTHLSACVPICLSFWPACAPGPCLRWVIRRNLSTGWCLPLASMS
jgi:hypothetical protein